MIATGVGGINFSKFGKVGAPLVRAGAHGLTQGGFSALRGGNFWHGFASGTIGSLASTSSQGIDSFGAKVAISSTASGASSAVAGGSFTDGAVTGAYVYLFNHHVHQIETNARIKKQIRKNGSGALGYQNRRNDQNGAGLAFDLRSDEYKAYETSGFEGDFNFYLREKESAIRVPNEKALAKYAGSGLLRDVIKFVEPKNRFSNGVVWGLGGMALFVETTGLLLIYNNPTMLMNKKQAINAGIGILFSGGAGFIYGVTHFKEEPNGK